MSNGTFHPSSAGSLIKKIVEINPQLKVHEIAAILKQATRGDKIDDAKALALARATLKPA